MKHYEHTRQEDFKNPFLDIICRYPKDLLYFGKKDSWTKIDQNNLDILDFPSVFVELKTNHVFDYLPSNSIYYFSIGPYEIKNAAKYLNTIGMEDKFFETALLKPESTLYQKLQSSFLRANQLK